jgi:thymidine kinase
MDLTLILGPMKSGKSFELIDYFSPLKYTNLEFVLYQPTSNVRDKKIESRVGVSIDAKKVDDLSEALERKFDVVGVDEIHMFNEREAAVISELLRRGTKVIVSGLYMNYQGKMFDIVRLLFELGPKEVKIKQAVCEICRKPEAIYTQLYDKKGVPILGGLSEPIPEDGTYIYKPVCRHCFIRG